MTLNATDLDLGANALVHYRLAPSGPGDPDPETFLVQPETGVITLRSTLDHEEQRDLRFLVVATDSGNTALSHGAYQGPGPE